MPLANCVMKFSCDGTVQIACRLTHTSKAIVNRRTVFSGESKLLEALDKQSIVTFRQR